MEKEWKIGEIADLFGIDVQTLHLYDKQGLLVPESRNPENNWRLYHFNQVYPLAMIRYLRRLGCSLASIQDFMQERNLSNTGDYFRHQSARLRQQCEELLRLDAIIQLKLAFVEREMKDIHVQTIRVQGQKAMHYVNLGKLDEVFQNELFYFYPTLVFYKGESLNFGAYIIEDSMQIADLIREKQECLHEIPSGEYLIGYHEGAFSSIQETFQRMRQSTEMALEEEVICINIIDQFVEVDENKYLTKVLIKCEHDS